ncbi:hypothetical protein [Streptomyces sp. 2231.1]|uniref:hypothetical protein n=1 Tax=Streptomyces sp. 2231.1 TaxID=1855347 RepID=UPI00115F9A12|nr:hypothetical protein [Streptomyces sp. 2231.1]
MYKRTVVSYRRLGRTRAIEAITGADDFDADLAERYGWINRALPDAELRLRRAPGQAHCRIPTRRGQGREARDQ